MPLIKDGDLLKVTTIKAKYVEQMQTLGDTTGSNHGPNRLDDSCELVGELSATGQIIVRKAGRFYRVSWLVFYDYLRTEKGKTLEEAQAEHHAMPCLFAD